MDPETNIEGQYIPVFTASSSCLSLERDAYAVLYAILRCVLSSFVGKGQLATLHTRITVSQNGSNVDTTAKVISWLLVF